MLIGVPPNFHYPIHRHLDTDEFYFVLRGSLYVSSFDSSGIELNCIELIPFTDTSISTHGFIMERDVFHDTRAGADGALFLEVRSGPFDRTKTKFFGSFHAPSAMY